MTSIMGRLVDKANIVRASFSDLEKAVIKATRHNLKGPKEKHVRRLIVSTFEQPGKNSELITLLAKRLEIVDWITVMKTLEVFHRLLRDGNSTFINDLKYKSSIFNLRSFKDIATPEAHYQSIFIQKYSQYLEEKVLVFKMLNMEFERDPNITKSFSVDDAFEKVPRLQSQLNALLNCRASKNHINNPIIVYGFTLLLKDSFKLYRALNDSIISLLEHYFSMGKPNAAKALEIYKLFTKETDGIIQFFDITRKFSKNDLPELQHAPTTLVEALENYIKDIEDGRSNSNSNERGKKLVQQFQDFKFDDASFQQEGQVHDDDSDSDDDVPHNKPAPQIPQNRSNSNVPPPLFDPFADDVGASSDNLPTFGTNNTNSNNFFDDPFATKPVTNNNPNQFNDKKKQIEAVMTTAAYGAPLQPTAVANNNNNNFFGTGGFTSNAPNTNNAPGPNYSPFGPTGTQPNNFGGFPPQNNNFGGFPPQNNNFGGFPPQNNQQPYNNQPFGNNNGFGFPPQQQQQQPVNTNPFGNSNNNTNPFLTGNTSNTTSNNTNNNFNPFA